MSHFSKKLRFKTKIRTILPNVIRLKQKLQKWEISVQSLKVIPSDFSVECDYFLSTLFVNESMNEQLLNLQHQETNSKANKQNSKMLINIVIYFVISNTFINTNYEVIKSHLIYFVFLQQLMKNSPFPNLHLFLTIILFYT